MQNLSRTIHGGGLQPSPRFLGPLFARLKPRDITVPRGVAVPGLQKTAVPNENTSAGKRGVFGRGNLRRNAWIQNRTNVRERGSLRHGPAAATQNQLVVLRKVRKDFPQSISPRKNVFEVSGVRVVEGKREFPLPQVIKITLSYEVL